MSGLKDIKTRISAVSSNMKITSAMKMVSASKFRKSVDKMYTLKTYESRFKEIKDSLIGGKQLQENKFLQKNNKSNRLLIITVASNRGLCGPFNSNISKKMEILINTDYKQYDVEIISLSKKVYDLQKGNIRIRKIENRHELLDNPSYENVVKFSEEIIDKFLLEGYSKIIFIYNSFKNASTQIIKDEVLLPLEKEGIDENKFTNDEQFIFEPNKEQILDYLLPQSIKLKIFRIILESLASEHGARMTAMHKATENATDLRKTLLLDYNKIRQASITNQIIEIVSGAEAV